MGEPLIPGGYILVARKILNSGIFSKPPLYLSVWIYLLSRAQHRDYKELKRGQLWTSIPEIQDALTWKVGYRTERPTKKQIFTVLEWLRNPSERVHDRNNESPMIVTTKGTHGMLVTVCNYNVYQTSENYEGNDERTTTGTTKSLRQERQGNNINKNVFKNDKNVKNDNKKDNSSKQILNERFNELWKYYPRKQGKAKALKAYEKAIKEGITDEAIMNGLQVFNIHIKEDDIDKDYIPMGSTWFSSRRWEDEYVENKTGTTYEQDWSVPKQNQFNVDGLPDSMLDDLPF